MAFALKVRNARADIFDCPFVSEHSTVESDKGAQQASFSNFEQVSQELDKEATAVDFREAADVVGGQYESENGREIIRITMNNRDFELRKEGLYHNDSYCGDPWTKIILYDYVRRKGRSSLTGEWITLGHFPHTASHVKAFQSNGERKVVDAFREDPNRLKARCEEMGGYETRGKVKADYLYCFDLLPNVPLYLSFMAADEEFDADCTILFDSSAEEFIDIEYLAYLLERFIDELTGKS